MNFTRLIVWPTILALLALSVVHKVPYTLVPMLVGDVLFRLVSRATDQLCPIHALALFTGDGGKL